MSPFTPHFDMYALQNYINYSKSPRQFKFGYILCIRYFLICFSRLVFK